MAYGRNVCVVRVSKLVDAIISDLQNIKYNPANMLINSNNFDKSDLLDSKDVTAPEIQSLADAINIIAGTDVTRQTKARVNSNILNKLCTQCVESKSTQVIRQKKNIIAILKKLKEVHVDL